MKKFTQDELLHKIFYKNKDPLSAKMTVYKSRYKYNKLSQELITKIIKQHGYEIAQEVLYKRKK